VLDAQTTGMFYARLTASDGEECYTEIYTREVNQHERHLIFEGNWFTWVIYQYTPRVTNHAYSDITFDDLDYWAQDGINSADSEVRKLQYFGYDEDLT
jgi:hypothetical protein